MSDQPIRVRNDTTASRFVVEVDGVEAELRYRHRAGRLVLIHTGVPEVLGGRGIGVLLVRAAIAYARAEHLTIVPWCPFAHRWIADHADEVQGVPIDWEALPASGSDSDG